MRKFISTGLLALGCWAGAAQAAPVISFTPGGSGTPAGETLVQGFDTTAAGTQIQPGVYVLANSVPGIADKPTGASGNFAAVTAGSSYNLTFSQATGLFSFVLGTLDLYNSLIVTYVGGATQRFDGTAIIGGLGSTMSEGLATYSAGTGPMFAGVSFLSTTQNSFEIDTISAAVPEAASWGMMILGLGLVGGVLRRRTAGKLQLV